MMGQSLVSAMTADERRLARTLLNGFVVTVSDVVDEFGLDSDDAHALLTRTLMLTGFNVVVVPPSGGLQ